MTATFSTSLQRIKLGNKSSFKNCYSQLIIFSQINCIVLINVLKIKDRLRYFYSLNQVLVQVKVP